jgi:hypothetical protein
MACTMLAVEEQDLSRRLVHMIERTEELVENAGGVVRSRQVVAMLIAIDEESP